MKIQNVSNKNESIVLSLYVISGPNKYQMLVINKVKHFQHKNPPLEANFKLKRGKIKLKIKKSLKSYLYKSGKEKGLSRFKPEGVKELRVWINLCSLISKTLGLQISKIVTKYELSKSDLLLKLWSWKR